MEQTNTERRRAQRIPAQLHAEYWPGRSDSMEECVVMDVSRSGMGMIMDESTEEGKLLIVNMHLSHHMIDAVGKVVWAKKLFSRPSFKYAAGIRFVSIESMKLSALIAYAEIQNDKAEEEEQCLIFSQL